MLSVKEICAQIKQLLSNAVSLDEFEDWIVGASWNMHQHSEGAVQRLVSSIELRLSEYSSGHLDENDLRNELSAILESGQKLPTIKVQENITAVSSASAANVPMRQFFLMAKLTANATATVSRSGPTITVNEILDCPS